MKDDTKLTEDQERRIKATLKRIHGGLHRIRPKQPEEPAHVFNPGSVNAQPK